MTFAHGVPSLSRFEACVRVAIRSRRMSGKPNSGRAAGFRVRRCRLQGQEDRAVPGSGKED